MEIAQFFFKFAFFTRFCIEAAMATLVFMKTLPCLKNRKKLIELYHKTQEMNSYLKESSTERTIAYGWLRSQRKLTNFILIPYMFMAVASFSVRALKTHTFPLAPEIIPKPLHKLPWSLFVYFYEMVISFLRITTAASCDVYLIIFMCQVCCELQIAGNVVQAIDIRDKYSILRAIKIHKRALEYGHAVCEEISSAIVIQYLGMSLGICFAAIAILTLKDQTLLARFTVITFILGSQVLLLCYAGEIIFGESLKIADHLESKIEEFFDDGESLRAISFMILRAQRPLKLRVGNKTIICLNLFRKTMSKIFSVFLLLKRVMAE